MNERLLIALLAIFTTLFAYAEEIKPHQTIEYGGKSYQLTYAAKIAEPGGGRSFYYYTLGDETKDQWSSMVVVQFAPHLHINDKALARDVAAYFDASNPRPYYRIVNIGGSPFARYMNPSINGQPSDSSVMRFFPDGCGGQVVFQYLEKVDASDVHKAWRSNETALRDLVEFSWYPDCIEAH